jgi:hypothetical protein
LATYRIELRADDGLLEDWRFVECADDDGAISNAAEIEHPHETCVWDGERLVARLSPKS